MCEQCETQTEVKTKQLSSTPLLSETEVTGDQTIIFFEPFEISTENLAEDVEFDKDEFKRGLKEGSYVAGLFTALINSGIDLESATTFILNNQNIEMNTEITKIQTNAQIEASKNKSVVIESQQL
jgi:hypothetical protein